MLYLDLGDPAAALAEAHTAWQLGLRQQILLQRLRDRGVTNLPGEAPQAGAR